MVHDGRSGGTWPLGYEVFPQGGFHRPKRCDSKALPHEGGCCSSNGLDVSRESRQMKGRRDWADRGMRGSIGLRNLVQL